MLNLRTLKGLRSPLRIAAITALLIGFGVGCSGSTQAAAVTQSITISPTAIDESLQPGSVTNGSFQIINSGSSDYTFHVYATPYRVSDEAYNPDFTALPGAPKVVSWIHFSSSTTKLSAKQVVTINYSIHVPAGTTAGGYYAVAFAETQALPSPTTGVAIADRVGEIFYLRVAGNARQAGSVRTWRANWLQQSPVTALVRIEDSGAYNFPATITIQVKNVFGRTVYSFATTRQLLPQTIRRIPISWNDAPTVGLFKVGGTVSLLNHTNPLPTEYVVIMPQTVRFVLIGLVILMLLVATFRWASVFAKKR